MSSTLFPPSAIPFPPAPGGGFPEYRITVISSITDQVTHQNAVAKSNFDGACSNWTLANLRNRELGLPITDKPAVPVGQVVNTFHDTNSDIIYLWLSEGSPLASPCPDLPALPPTPPANNVDIGVQISGAFYQCQRDDTVASGTNITVPVPLPNGVPAGQYTKSCSPFGCVYQKVA